MLKSDKGQYIDIDGMKTFYIKAGSGYPLLLIHGGSPGACSLINWGANIEPLAASGFTVYAYDQPGFGHTDNPKDYSLEYRVNHTRSFIDALKLDRFHLVGNSMGAYIAARIALEDKRTGKLVLVSSGTLAPKGSPEAEALSKAHGERLRGYTPSLENARTLTMGTLFDKKLVTEELVQERYEMSAGKNFEAQSERRGGSPPKRINEELPNLKVKTLILWGNNDRGAATERALPLFQSIPGAELHIFDECAHWVQRDKADRFHKIVVDFLKPKD